MKTIKKNVYYCDHCKKRSLSASHMTKHEDRCTNNPHRNCKICEILTGGSDDLSEVIDGMKKRFEIVIEKKVDPVWDMAHETEVVKWIGEPITMEEILKITDKCPNCTLAILRQVGLNRYYFKEEFKYGYKEEMKSAMAQINAVRREEESAWY